jgi:ribosomal protein L7Ae-like RNA K-turn-binding protein
MQQTASLPQTPSPARFESAPMLHFALSPEGTLCRVAEKYAAALNDVIQAPCNRKVLSEWRRTDAFRLRFGARAVVPESLEDDVERDLRADLLQALHLAKKAGRVISGFEKIKPLLKSGKVAIVIQASDGSKREQGRLTAGFAVKKASCFSASELGKATGRETSHHAALLPGAATALWLERYRMLEMYNND